MDFSFCYEGKKYRAADLRTVSRGSEETYELGCLRITRESRKYAFGAEYSLLHFENAGKENSGVLSEICDIDIIAPVPAGISRPGYKNADGIPKIFYTVGALDGQSEYKQRSEPLYDYWGNRYACEGGRSSKGFLPFFEAQNEGKGFLFAVGWTGQWFARFDREGGSIRVRAGIENLGFYLEPGEKIRTASVLAMPFEGDPIAAHNAFRRLIARDFSVYPDEKLGAPPLCMQAWGGASSEFLKRQIEKEYRENLGFEYFWVDAGWYGDYEELCPDEFVGRWGDYTGDWHVNGRVHPGGLKDVFELAEKRGLKGLLWLEPERISKNSAFYKEHREMLLECGEDSGNALLDLSREDAKKWMLETVSHFIEEFHLSCYRQDFNTDPLPFWNKADPENRKGITQIKHIMGLYEVWDKLRERFPDLVIDNCSSGGKRIDIETLRRSIPLWRSDTNCGFDFEPEYAQNQNMGLSYWIPWHGDGVARFADDKYRFRSCHAAALATNFLGYEAFGNEPYDFDTVRFLIEEYKSVRKYYACDYYPIFGHPEDEYAWAGWQFHDEAADEGVVVAFRRKKALAERVTVPLGGLKPEKIYEFIHSDTGEKKEYTGAELKEKGLPVTLHEKRSSALFRYREKGGERKR